MQLILYRFKFLHAALTLSAFRISATVAFFAALLVSQIGFTAGRTDIKQSRTIRRLHEAWLGNRRD